MVSDAPTGNPSHIRADGPEQPGPQTDIVVGVASAVDRAIGRAMRGGIRVAEHPTRRHWMGQFTITLCTIISPTRFLGGGIFTTASQ